MHRIKEIIENLERSALFLIFIIKEIYKWDHSKARKLDFGRVDVQANARRYQKYEHERHEFGISLSLLIPSRVDIHRLRPQLTGHAARLICPATCPIHPIEQIQERGRDYTLIPITEVKEICG